MQDLAVYPKLKEKGLINLIKTSKRNFLCIVTKFDEMGQQTDPVSLPLTHRGVNISIQNINQQIERLEAQKQGIIALKADMTALEPELPEDAV